ncbi:MAG: histidine phosphatase family protein [Synergistaceae bacterium]|nr:histidine phosphatase family protein [Synergistaceae bacterium]
MSLTDRRIILARHGQTEWNLHFRFQGRTNIQLTDEGMSQAHSLAERLKSWPPDVIYSSPLDRAMFTAKTAADKFGLVPVIIPELEEINFGSWEGLSLVSLEQEQPVAYNRWRSDPFFNPPDGAETWPEIETRLNRAVNIMLGSPHKRIIAVTHGGIIRALYAVILGLNPHKTWYIDAANCSMSGIEIIGQRRYLSFTNDNLHIKAGKYGETLPVWGDEA